jgi:hypothetical protein
VVAAQPRYAFAPLRELYFVAKTLNFSRFPADALALTPFFAALYSAAQM